MIKNRPVDLDNPIERDVAFRIGNAWKELRRGASMRQLRGRIFGEGDDALDPGQVDTLDLLVQRDSWRMSDLAEALRIDPSTATRAMQRLDRSGLSTREPNDDDRRLVMASATTLGRKRHEVIAERRRHMLSHMLSGFTPEERSQLADLLERLVHGLDEYAEEVGEER
jgi:DNA-binding MarR family transcriptional regulator